MFFGFLERFRARRKAKSVGMNRSRLMNVKVVLPLPEWCVWLTTETLACIHDYCWRNNLDPDAFNYFSRKQLVSIAGRLAAREITEARGYEEYEDADACGPDAASAETGQSKTA